VPAFFEGGQNSLVHRMPTTRGQHFRSNPRKERPVTVNLRQLGQFAAGQSVDQEALVAAGLVDHRARKVKVLGDGEMPHALIVVAHEFSAGARAKIEAAGGQVVVVGAPATEEE
jgi:large subunit ribosomal protein L15